MKSKFTKDKSGVYLKNKIIDCVSAVVILSFCPVQTAWAAAQARQDVEKDKATDQPEKSLPKSIPWLDMGADFRFRVVYDDARKLDREATGHDRLNTRYRGRVWTKLKQSEDFDFNIRIMTEPRYYHRPPSMDKQFTHNEALFDRLNCTWRNVFGLPITAKVGRQDIRLGSNWLVLDGTPLDGANTHFFDAIRLTYDLQDRNTTTDLIWIDNHGDSAKLLKPFNDQDIDLAEQDERGLVLYVSDKSRPKTQLDGYFIYKNDHARNRSSGSEGNIYTLGTLVKADIDKHWKYQLEFAPQFGHKNGKELNAFATNNQLTYHFNDSKNSRVYIGYEYLSGDDDPDKYFDKVWGRVDTWSVLHQDSIDSIDGRKIDSSNLHRVHFGWITKPTEKTKVQTTYNLLFADDNTSAGGTGGLSKSGNFRGQLLRAEVKHKINKHMHHRLEGELFLPGDFYNDDRNDVAVLVRYGIVFTW